MSCIGDAPTFRLLDAYVGWDEVAAEHLTGLTDAAGLRLAQGTPGEVDANRIAAALPPPRLARGCGLCKWYLLTPPPTRLLRRDPCTDGWQPVWRCDPGLFSAPVAVASRGHLLAVSDPGAGKLWVWVNGGEKLAAVINLPQVGPLAFAPWGELLVAQQGKREILRFGYGGDARGALQARAPGEVERLAVSQACVIWLVTREANGALKLWRARREDTEFVAATPEELASAFKPTGLVAVSELGFCLEERGADGLPVTSCWSWYGRAVEEGRIVRPSPPLLETAGRLLTRAIDSGKPRCRWHRVRVDADVPPGTTLSISVATSEREQTGNPATAEYPQDFPNPADWTTAHDGSLDFLIDQPPGRYLFLQMRLTGDGRATPVVRRLRLDFPRLTSLEYLPPVYRERPEAEDFTERFLALFDASIGELDRAIERAPALLDPAGAPAELLPWLGSFLDLAFDPAWEAERRRQLLRALPELYRRRGTVAGLRQAIKLVFDVEPAIQEQWTERAWGGLGQGAALRSVRLFGKARARFRVGSSALASGFGGAPLRSFGNPDHDPFAAQAYRFRVSVPPGRWLTLAERERLEQLVASQKPAHTVATVQLGGNGLVLGYWSAVGVDTLFAAPPAPVLGVNLRLGRMSVLRVGPRGLRSGIVPGVNALVGETTIVQ
jgi:phage tail-like protein